MIRLDYYIRRKPSLSVAKFQQYWRDVHAPLWERHADALGIRRHIHWEDRPDHPMAAPTREAYKIGGEPFDGVGTSMWADIRVLEAALQTELGQAAYQEILSDEANFIDHGRSYLGFGVEHAIAYDREKLYATKDAEFVRGIYWPNCLEGHGIDEIHRHWIAVHGGLSHDFAVGSANRRYMQVHAGNYHLYHQFLSDRNMKINPLYFGHAEAITSPEEVEKAAKLNRPDELFQYFIDDIDNFADPATAYFGFGKEYLVVDKQIYTKPLPKPIPRGERLPYKDW